MTYISLMLMTYLMSYVLYLIHLKYFSLMLDRVMLTGPKGGYMKRKNLYKIEGNFNIKCISSSNFQFNSLLKNSGGPINNCLVTWDFTRCRAKFQPQMLHLRD